MPQAVTSTGTNAGKIGVGADPGAIEQSKVTGAARLRDLIASGVELSPEELIITKETGSAPGAKPGPIVVRGKFVKAPAK